MGVKLKGKPLPNQPNLDNLTPEQAQEIEEKQFINAVSIQGVMAIGTYKGVIHLKERLRDTNERLERVEKQLAILMKNANLTKEDMLDLQNQAKHISQKLSDAPESKQTKPKGNPTQAHLNTSGINPDTNQDIIEK